MIFALQLKKRQRHPEMYCLKEEGRIGEEGEEKEKGNLLFLNMLGVSFDFSASSKYLRVTTLKSCMDMYSVHTET